MIAAKIEEPPQIKGIIRPMNGRIKGTIYRSPLSIKGVIFSSPSLIKGTITKDVEKDPYYEVSNEYGGKTIFIGE